METEAEKALFKKGEENYMAKKALRKRSLLEIAPDQQESNLIHSMWTREMAYLSMPIPLAQRRTSHLLMTTQIPRTPSPAPRTKSS